MQQNKHNSLKCPEYGCDTVPSAEEIQNILDGKVFQKYQEYQTNTKVAMDKNLIFCTTPDCPEIMDISFAKNKKLFCNKCMKASCSQCKSPYHGNNSCEKHSLQQYEKWAVGLDIHKCPKCGC